MNYLAHGRLFLDDPYFLAGTAIPDWLGAVDRPARIRSKRAAPFVDAEDPRLASLARGIVQHHRDDAWFHESPAFGQLQLSGAAAFRKTLPEDRSLRPSFLGHIVVELLLDSVLAERQPGLIDAYYAAMQRVEPAAVEAYANQMAPRPTSALARMIAFFCRERFLYDYQEDAKLLMRLNNILLRVGLTPLPGETIDILPQLRSAVRAQADRLLAAPDGKPQPAP